VRHDRPQHAAGDVIANPRETDRGVDGTYAQRSTVASRSSPAAAQRCAEGAGLDGGDRGRSTITRAVHRSRFHRHRSEDRHFNYITNLHQLDGRGRGCGGRAGKVELMTGIDGSSRPVRKIVLRAE
jgi:hypothetical protein